MPRIRTYGLDIDTIRYAQRVKTGSGTTILPEPLKQINKFVVGVKKLGLWNSMVCWPMRSIHNAGTGSTVYSLGGYSDQNGSLINGPSWSAQGITVNTGQTLRYANSLTIPQKYFFSFVFRSTSNTFEAVYSQTAADTYSAPYLGWNWFNQGRMFCWSASTVVTQFPNNRYSTGISMTDTTSIHYISYSNLDGGLCSIFNHGIDRSTSGSNPQTVVASTVTNPQTVKQGVYKFMILGNNFDPEIIRPLYKRTLGIGLNLP